MKKNINRIITRHLSGEATLKEQEEFRSWLCESDQNKDEFNKLALTYQLTSGQGSDGRKKKVFVGILNKIDGEHTSRQRRVERRSRVVRISLSIAASLALVISLSALFVFHDFGLKQPIVSSNMHVVKSNPSGQKSKIFLPDGSIVWLNSESVLHYAKDFSDSVRFIVLEGEAYFEVKKDQMRPFVVKSGTISITALGTSFNVNAFGEDQKVLIGLTSGKILVENDKVDSAEKSLIINPGEGVVYNPEEGEHLSKIAIDVDEIRKWKDGILVLKNATMDETIIRLKRWYGVDIILNNEPVLEWKANGLFDNEYLDNVLNLLSFSHGFEYKMEGKEVYITFKHETPMN